LSHPTTGQEGRVAARRYRDLYPQGAAGFDPADVNQFQEKYKPKDTRRARFADEPSWIDDDREYEDDDDNDDGQELRGVLNRFEDRSSESVDDHSGRALERSHSFEALKGKHETLAVPLYRGRPGHRDTEYAFDDDGLTVGNRNSRWSESIYSRNSILDADASGQRREILVKRVEEMLEVDSNKLSVATGMGMGRGYIPPVPKVPNAYANMGGQINADVHLEVTSPGRSWTKF
jgi:hypothetical protein